MKNLVFRIILMFVVIAVLTFNTNSIAYADETAQSDPNSNTASESNTTDTSSTDTSGDDSANGSTSNPTDTPTNTPNIKPAFKRVDVANFENIQQLPNYPSGCEITSAAMALRYIGYKVSNYYLVKKFLPVSNNFYYKNGKKYGPDLNVTFAGNPSLNYYGCFAPVIVSTINKYLVSEKAPYVAKQLGVADIKKSIDNLYKNIDNNTPVIVWATTEMQDVEYKTSWYLPNGQRFNYPKHEHCLVLIGYDDTNVTLSDPFDKRKTVFYSRKLFEKRFSQLGSQAVIITKQLEG